jgi:hypothetical protein
VGMDQTVTFAERGVPEWPAVRDLLASLGYPAQVRMIDGELAFPDEEPPGAWRELRLGAAGGMVTLRRSTDSVTFVTWGNADPGQQQLWNALTWAFAEAGAGTVRTEHGTVDAATFRRVANLPQVLRI